MQPMYYLDLIVYSLFLISAHGHHFVKVKMNYFPISFSFWKKKRGAFKKLLKSKVTGYNLILSIICQSFETYQTTHSLNT